MSPTPETPPTDRPLTAGEWIEWHGGENPVPGTWVEVNHRGHIMGFKVGWGTADNMRWTHNGSIEDIIAYRLSRPATSAASEVEGVDLRSCAHDAAVALEAVLNAPEDESRHPHARHYLDRLKAALASPPVSERERELEALVADFLTFARSGAHFAYPLGSLQRLEALAAQPQEPV